MSILYIMLGIVLIPGLIMGAWAQTKVYTTFNKYNKEDTLSGKTANEVARKMLDGAGCKDTKVQPIKGELTDNFNPKTNTVSLSEGVYNNVTISAIGVTAHEIGHVFQHKQGYAPNKVRSALVPIINISGFFVWPLIFIGLLMELSYNMFAADLFIYLGIGLYALSTVFCLVTLPLELNASKRAYKMLIATNEMTVEEAKKAKKVLDAAALTYVAALVTSVLSLLRLVLYVFIIRRND